MANVKKFIYISTAANWEANKSFITAPEGKWYKSIVFRADTGEIWNRGKAYGVGTENTNAITDLKTATAALVSAKILSEAGTAGSKSYANGLGIKYDSAAKTIYLTGSDNNQLTGTTPIDCTDFIKDGMLSNAELVTTAEQGVTEEVPYIKLTFNTDGGNQPIRFSVKSLVDLYDGANLKLSTSYADKAANAQYESSNIKSGASLDTVIAELKKGHERLISNGSDQITDDTIKGAKLYAENEARGVIGNGNVDTKDSPTIFGAKKYADNLVTTLRTEISNADYVTVDVVEGSFEGLTERIDAIAGTDADTKETNSIVGVKKLIDENEEVTAGALADLNTRMESLEGLNTPTQVLNDAKAYTDSEIQKLDVASTEVKSANDMVKVTYHETDGKVSIDKVDVTTAGGGITSNGSFSVTNQNGLALGTDVQKAVEVANNYTKNAIDNLNAGPQYEGTDQVEICIAETKGIVSLNYVNVNIATINKDADTHQISVENGNYLALGTHVLEAYEAATAYANSLLDWEEL